VHKHLMSVFSPNQSKVNGLFTWIAIALGAGALSVGVWHYLHSRDAQLQLELELGRRLQMMQLELTKSQTDLNEAKAQANRSEQRVAALESKFLERDGERVQLEEMFKELARGTEDRALAEVEQALVTADQQLKISGNVSGALIALSSADQRLARLEKISTVDLRRAISQDSERLRALPQIDRVGLALKIDNVIAVLPSLSLVMSETAADGRVMTSTVTNAPSATKAVAGEKQPIVVPHQESSWWQRAGGSVWDELKQLVRIRELDSEPPLLAPQQQYFLRENLKLRLLSARQALLAYDEQSYRTDIKSSAEWVQKYFDPKAKAVTSVSETLKTLQASQVVVSIPDINRSLSAVREARARKDRAVR
jgi:uroporphyrin-III C-methyltransferase